MFIDVAKIKIKAGDGGNGAVSFHREKYVAAGGPDGGDGGKGGNVVFRVDSSLSTLADFRYKRKYVAKNGENGKGKRASGKSAEDLVIRVPKGTLVKDAETGKIIADVSKENEEFVIAKGGKGGYGNMHFATPTRQVPRFSKPGLKGEEMEIQLELKLLADVGLVGFPNVGKSTLISVVSHAKPVIANYHFTTITPVLGVVRMQEGSSFVIADIPGLIEGAGEGLGLGHQFLRHIERCRLLIHVVDVSGSEGRNPIEDFNTINEELIKFNPELSKRPMIVAMNKCDLATEEQIKEFKSYIKSNGYETFEIMAPIRYGVDSLLKKVQETLANLPPIKVYEAEYIPNALEANDDNEIKVEKVNGKYYVEGKRIERLIGSINFDDYESLQYFQKKLVDFGAIDMLHKEGIQEGDTVNIYDEFCEYKNLSPLALAFVGDSVFDLLVKEQLVCKANRPIKKLHKLSVDRVCCQTQSKYIEKLMDFLTDEEIKIYKRGRNAYTHHTPKNATNAEYHSATGFEALIGYLYLKGDINRLREIFEILN